MYCSSEGATPIPNTVCVTQCEANIPGISARCKIDPCRCAAFHAGHQVCPSQFPSTCPLDKDKIYMCDQVDDLPQEVGDCAPPKKCEVLLDEGRCVTPVNPCKCPSGKVTVRRRAIYTLLFSNIDRGSKPFYLILTWLLGLLSRCAALPSRLHVN